MKVVNMRELQRSLKDAVDAAQEQSVVVTRRGKPTALLLGVEGLDWEEVLLQTNTDFWNMLQARRQQGESAELSEVRKRLEKKS